MISGRTTRTATRWSALVGGAAAIVSSEEGMAGAEESEGLEVLSAFISGAGVMVAVVRSSTAVAVAACFGVVPASDCEVGFGAGNGTVILSEEVGFCSARSTDCRSACLAGGASMRIGAVFFAIRAGAFGALPRILVVCWDLSFNDCLSDREGTGCAEAEVLAWT